MVILKIDFRDKLPVSIDFLTAVGRNEPNIVRNGGIVVPRQGLTTETVVGAASPRDARDQEMGAVNTE